LTKSALSKDITGRVFGELTAIKIAEIGPRGGRTWLCRCSCGAEVIVPQKRLESGNTRSCGHLKVLATVSRNKSLAKDLTNTRFGQWLVLSLHPHRNKEGGLLWRCVCDCGNVEIVSSARLLRGRSDRCTVCVEKEKHPRFCANGHDVLIWGRKHSNCNGCVKERHLKRNYGIGLEDFKKMYKHQNGLCAICGTPLRDYEDIESMGKRAEVDHEHTETVPKRQTVRGLLCGGAWQGCNKILGHVDDIRWLRKAVEYVENPPARQVLSTDADKEPCK